MKISQVCSIIILWIAAAGSVSAQPPSDLFDWLKLLHNDEYRLHSAIDQNGFWFAVRTDSDGDILFSYHRHDDRDTGDSEYTLRIADERGADLHDVNSAKPNPKPIKIVSKRQKIIGDVTTETEFTYSYRSGVIRPLKENAPKAIVVSYTRKNKDGTNSDLFRQKIFPQKSSDNKTLGRSGCGLEKRSGKLLVVINL